MRSVLAIGAHPDDIELGCGGTLAAHRAAGDRVTMLVLTGGQNGPGSNTERVDEQEHAAKVLDATLVWGGQIDCTLVPDVTTIKVIETALQESKATVVYVHSLDDSHQDHRAAGAATLSAARQSCTVLHYRSPSTVKFNPTFFVDVSLHLDRKLAALTCHRSQVAASAMVEPEVIVASARHYGALARVQYAEAFTPARFVWDLEHDGMLVDGAHTNAASIPVTRTTVG